MKLRAVSLFSHFIIPIKIINLIFTTTSKQITRVIFSMHTFEIVINVYSQLQLDDNRRNKKRYANNWELVEDTSHILLNISLLPFTLYQISV